MATITTRPPRIIPLRPAALKAYYEAKLAAELGPHNVKRLIDMGRRDVVMLDVRTPDDFRKAHVPGAINIPFEELPERLKELPKTKEVISYCWDVTCLLSTKASYLLASRGYKAREMSGGIEAWRKSGFPIKP